MDDNIVVEPHVRAAQDAFWGVIAERFPELSSGDMPPEIQVAFDEACYAAVWMWLGANVR